MNPFTYHRANEPKDALEQLKLNSKAKFIGGGTNLLDLMKENIEKPAHLIDINHVGLRDIRPLDDGGLSIGALVTNAHAAYDQEIERRYPLLSEAILAGASAQLRNMATCGGNLLQRTRCYYFYDKAGACNKREPGSGCDARQGINRIHAVLGASEACIATHPSDMCVALAALDARIHVMGPRGSRVIEFRDFHRLPEDHPEIDTTLGSDELITSIDLPKKGFTQNSSYIKIRDRASYAFALVSVAAALEIKDGKILDIRVALGGVAHKPWRDFDAEKSAIGSTATAETFSTFASRVMAPAKGYEHNAFKIDLAKRAMVRALSEAAKKGVH
jgi:xanthine dehydrogenase YagS FAD-binding subunit